LSSEDKKAPDASSKRADYTRVVQAVKRLGFPDEAAHIIWRVLAAILHLGNMEFVAKVRTGRTVQQAGRQAGTEGGGGHAACKQAGMQTNSHPYRKLESVLTSRQQVLRSSAGRHRGSRQMQADAGSHPPPGQHAVRSQGEDRQDSSAGRQAGGGGGHAACKQAGIQQIHILIES
jgi:hypothetical protein